MGLMVLSGAVRSGKSVAAEEVAVSRGGPVVVAVAGWDGDEEMARRIEAHRAARPTAFAVMDVEPDPAWIARVPRDSVLVLDCLATLVGAIAWSCARDSEVATADEEAAAAARVGALVDALVAREGDTVIVTNEAGWGVVPATAAGRLFRDLLGRANGTLVEAADAAYLVIDGRFLDLKALPGRPEWAPSAGTPGARVEEAHDTEGTK
jgi:adenosylcobinamide kinase/adenosylcobinamide-phosphate guanylyltransferase